jgi:hypothetical protein
MNILYCVAATADPPATGDPVRSTAQSLPLVTSPAKHYYCPNNKIELIKILTQKSNALSLSANK